MSTANQREPARSRLAVPKDPITRWLLLVAVLVVLLVIVGGFVRLSRAGLSIVEWDVVTGVLPPIGQEAWEESFAAYQQTPEYQLVNQGMEIGAYQRIFYYEWAHRLIARIAGMLVVVPLLWFLRRGYLTFRSSIRYWAVAALFAVQGAIGWLMVASGLKDRPVVSHFRLTIHLLAALTLLGITLWMALDRLRSEQRSGEAPRPAESNQARILAWALFTLVVIQIAYGGLVAGLKAGHVSDTWPLMFGHIIPPGVLTSLDPLWMNFVESLGAHWIHRWFAFAVVGVAVALYVIIRRDHRVDVPLRTATNWLLGAVAVQVVLGVLVVLLGVPKWFALAHQGTGVMVFIVALVIVHRIEADRTVPEAIRA